jgi:hypothetical protein
MPNKNTAFRNRGKTARVGAGADVQANLKSPKVYSTDPTTGKPWIMWPGTPYEHLMVPVK